MKIRGGEMKNIKYINILLYCLSGTAFIFGSKVAIISNVYGTLLYFISSLLLILATNYSKLKKII